MTNPLRRLLTCRGYGVHSPLAFRFIRMALRRPRGVDYYDLPRLTVGLSPRTRAQAARMWRVACFIKPSSVIISGEAPESLAEALRRPASSSGEGGRTLVLAATGADVRQVVAAAKSPCCVVVTEMSLWEGLTAQLPGLAFRSRSEGYIICRHGLSPRMFYLYFS